MADLELNSIGNGDGNNYLLRDNTKIPLSGSSAISGDLIPSTDNTVSLGSINNHIHNIYCTEVRGSDSNCCTVCGGSAWLKGAGITLRGKDYSGESGEFALVAVNDTNMSDLRGKPNGILMWNGKNIDCVEEQGDGYIRYTNGIQICWGKVIWQSKCTQSWGALYDTTTASEVYARSFIQTPYVSACFIGTNDTYGMIESSSGTNTSTPSFCVCRAYPIDAIFNWTVSYIAIGRWK